MSHLSLYMKDVTCLPLSSFPRLLSDILEDPISSLYFYTVSVLSTQGGSGTLLISKGAFVWPNSSLRHYLWSFEVLTKDFPVIFLASSLDQGRNIMSFVFFAKSTIEFNNEETSDKSKVRDILQKKTSQYFSRESGHDRERRQKRHGD